jgi:glycosyltransferase involved in cell wall biosynthesis
MTLHDERIFTGGCHYTLECRNFESGCKTCPFITKGLKSTPSRNLKQAKRLLTSDRNQITLVAPSNWISKEFSKSVLSETFKSVVIPNVHADLEYLTPSRPNSKRVRIGYASKYAKSWIKGFDILENLQRETEKGELKLDFIFMSNYSDAESIRSKFWKDIDFLLVPSRMDNSPNVIHEARFNGVPLITSEVGGIAELLKKEVDILIDIENFSSATLVSQILNYRWDVQRSRIFKEVQMEHKTAQIDSLGRLINLYLS